MRSVLGALRRAARKEGYAASGEPDAGIKVMPESNGRGTLAPRLELRHLRYFVAIVEHETIGRAAEHLGITLPALSRQIRDLEEGDWSGPAEPHDARCSRDTRWPVPLQ